MRDQKKSPDKLQKSLTIAGWVLCVILIPILIINCTLIIKSYANKKSVPDFAGSVPFIVLTDSMYPEIKSGDLILCKKINPDDVKVDDVISFFDPVGNGSAVITHKVVEIIDGDDGKYFRTRGINNNTDDSTPVHEDDVIARYTGFRLRGIGNIAMFMQSTAGLIICVVLPIILFVGYDFMRRKREEDSKSDDIEALKSELEALRAIKEKENMANSSEEQPSATESTEDSQ